MDISSKRGAGNSKGRKTTIVAKKSLQTSKTLKKDVKKGYLKDTKTSKTSFPKLKATQGINTIKCISKNKSVASKSLVKLPCQKNKPSKDVELCANRPGNVKAHKDESRYNAKNQKLPIKSEKKDISNDLGRSSKDEVFGSIGNEHNIPKRDLAIITEVDKKISQDFANATYANALKIKPKVKRRETGPNESSYMTGAVPKMSRLNNESNEKCGPRMAKYEPSTSYAEWDISSGDNNEKQIEKKSYSLHRDRIVETLKEIDEQIESEGHEEGKFATATRNCKKEEKTARKKKATTKKRTDEGRSNACSNTDPEHTNNTHFGTKKIDKYLCSLSGGEARKASHMVDTCAVEATDITEAVHAPKSSLNPQSFPYSSNCPSDNDVSFLLGNATASRISSTQKSISEKWKQKPASEIDSHTTNSNISQCESQQSNSKHETISDVQDDKTSQIEQKEEKPAINNVCEKIQYEEEKEIIDELSCPICYEVLHVPQRLDPCKHVFCDPCLRRMADAPRTEAAGCPMCRTEIKSCVTDNGK